MDIGPVLGRILFSFDLKFPTENADCEIIIGFITADAEEELYPEEKPPPGR
jgi:hypothetical protein